MKINEKKLEEVGALTEVESKEITKKKIGRKIALVYYYIVQIGFLAISGFIGYLFGLNGKFCAIYPYCGLDQNYISGSIIIVLTHGGNLGLTYGLRKKDIFVLKKEANTKISPYYVYPVVFLNFVLSVLFFLSIYHLMVYDIFTATTRYGVYIEEKSKRKNLRRRRYYV
ncbi:MAG: hypothetical protein ACTSQ4_01290 [Candidatus Heimdallarchaeaceae archaeon]